jgi:hypothetical protein
MTSKLFSNFPLKCSPPFLLSTAVFSTFFLGAVMAAGGSTPVQGLDDAKPVAQKVTPVVQSITAAPAAECPLNSGGPSLLGTTWRLDSLYGNKVPAALKIDMRVSTTSLTGTSGCNKYHAIFEQVGYTGFSVKTIRRTQKKCKVIIPYKAAKSINVGSWEGGYLRTLGRMGSVRQMTENKLYFFNRNGQIGMKFHKIADENKEAAAAAQKAAAKRRVELAKKVAAQKKAQQTQTVIKKSAPAQKAKPMPQKSEGQPVVRKINMSDDDLIMNFFNATGL